jgi:tRNA(Ile)-lysidine synthase
MGLQAPLNAPGAGNREAVAGIGLIAQFGAAMAALGPFGASPSLAVAVSGGADSMALAILADAWARERGCRMLALIADHGLRAEAAAEAEATFARLTALGIPAQQLRIAGLEKGSGLADRARQARYRVLADACARAGMAHLLLGHHAADQAETLTMRVLSGSGDRGMAGMAAATEARGVRILRPLLRVPSGRLRTFLRAEGVDWVEDPSNRSPYAQRARLRLLRNDPDGEGPGTQALTIAAVEAGLRRAANDVAIAKILAVRATVRPEGFALLSPGAIAPEALAVLLRTIAGAAYAPGIDRIAELAANLRPATVWGVRLLAAGKLGPGWLLVREEASLPPPVPAVDGAVWDARFRLIAPVAPECGTMFGAVGSAASKLRPCTDLPAAVLRAMPALWRRNVLVAVPQLHYPHAEACEWGASTVFDPPVPLTNAPFLPA